jgi:Holliday junction resolvasome RuvABC endonuclease subunit
VRILAIDPGNTESGYAVIERGTCKPIDIGKISNGLLRAFIRNGQLLVAVDHVAIEMVEGRGMPVGKDVFETVVWVGRFRELVDTRFVDPDANISLVYRRNVKLHHCGSSKAKDSNITQALVDRFASGIPNHGKGSKAEPGWFYGFKADIWAAYALAVYAADQIAGDVPAVAGVRAGGEPG